MAALDGLRAVAILGVLLFHTGHLPGGFLGVDLFFALSGYLITDLLLREAMASGTVSLVDFWARRVRRLLPALALMLAVISPLVWAVGSADQLRAVKSDGPWVQWELVNWHLLAESAGYWDRFGSARVFEHLWSIAVEEQFYLVWPVLVLLVARSGRRVEATVAIAAAVGSVISLALMLVLADAADPTRVYTGTDTRAFSLLLGAAVATRPVREGLARLARPWFAGALALVLAALWLRTAGVSSSWLFTGGLFVHSLAAALLVGVCVQAPRTQVARALAWAPARWLGSISYSVYLWHWPIVVLLPALGGWAETAAVGVGSIGVAALSKRLLEDPIRFRAQWARGRTGFLALIALMAGLAALWLVLPTPPAVSIDVTELVT